MISKSLKEYLDNNIGEYNNKLELAYSIYYLLGKVLYYSPLFVRYKLDNLVPDISSISLDNPYVNCETWSGLYNEILNEYGIDSRIIGDKHKQVEFNVDNYLVRADATLYLPDDIFDVSSDLTNIKFGLDILYFRLINNELREEFNNDISIVNKRFNINKGNDNKIINRIENNNTIIEGIDFYNEFYKLCDGEVERRQLFERYYPLLFSNINSDIVKFYDNGIISKHLLIFDNKYYLETKDGFIEKNYNEIIDLLDTKKIDLKYEKDHNKIRQESLKKARYI